MHRNQLNQIQNWAELAHRANYNPEKLARLCGVCLRHLQRFAAANNLGTPEAWLKRLRIQRASLLLAQPGSLIKQIATELGYNDPSQFSREFKSHYGFSPSDAQSALTPQMSPAVMKMSLPVMPSSLQSFCPEI
jgi:transcriptional regulator GlxA family with amidase domain